ncbi:MAG: RNA methyltransferase [Gammaproteobacteria bacterium]|nr:RNA methyltransferase [Gammaproteobacteria bacterium]
MQPLSNIRIVLVETSHPGNIGGVARALCNMGLDDLVLVSPARFPDPQAEWRAAGGVAVLRAARVVASLDEALADATLVIGTCGRDRRIPWPVLDAAAAAEQVVSESATGQVAIVFGREANGLNNDELMRCHLHLSIDADAAYGSLNLAMAVQVVAYEVRRAAMRRSQQGAPEVVWDRLPASYSDTESFIEHLERVLAEVDFLDSENPGQTMTRLRRLFARIRPDDTEIKMLRGVLTEIQRKLGTLR